MDKILGYKRANGSVGIRNYVVVIPSTACANGVAAAIAKKVPGVIPMLHGHGCGRGFSEMILHTRTLVNLGKHPNVAAVLVVGLGCETLKSDEIAGEIKKSGKPVEYLIIQNEGGSQKTANKGAAIVEQMLKEAAKVERENISLDSITLGLECGGSDAFSGVTANSAVGKASDWLVEQGGTVILTENTEMIGTRSLLTSRACNKAVSDAIDTLITNAEENSRKALGNHAHLAIAPGNMDGGLSSIMEKSLGCVVKGGSSSINYVSDYAEESKAKGLIIMDAPGYDTESLTGVVAGGAQLVVFTTGRGNPIGYPIVPVIKVASTTRLFNSMNDDMDINAGKILEGQSIEESGQEIVEKIVRVINGEEVKAEINEQGGIVCIYSTQASI